MGHDFHGEHVPHLLAGAAPSYDRRYRTLLFAFLAFRNLQTWHVSRPRATRPQSSAKENSARLEEGWPALHVGNAREAARRRKRVLDESRRKEERSRALDLLTWAALAEGATTHALAYLRQIKQPELARQLTRALALDAAGEAAQAQSYSLRALASEPSDTSASLVARSLSSLGQHDEAAPLLNEFLWRNPSTAASVRELLIQTRAVS
ncbi:hypothetical protein [Myxococcus sp. NMCA1]|uniref:hypothetical protein n=1 Tax=Myxococcus sp. NMCA1 TaxID=2996785 RepID=UPI0022860DA6|nr:hypothetical protein [Myxococcus sp. NMCA1]WAM30477.1 hypothetical protein OZ403_09485 [Myxococcus sp. NMCA1]